MRTVVIVSILALFSFCKKSNTVDISDIKELGSFAEAKILQQKKYQVSDRPGIEDVVLVESAGKKFLTIFSQEKRDFKMLRKTELPIGAEITKLSFLNIGNGTSHVLLLLNQAGAASLNMYDSAGFTQHIQLKPEDVEKLYIQKADSKPNDDLILTSGDKLRFNGLLWTHYHEDEIFPYIESLAADGDNARIEIVNRGGFGTRAIFTFSFPDLKGKSYSDYLKLTKDIPNVKLYKPGYPAHKYKGGNVSLSYPIIEVIKESFSLGTRIRLPLFMKSDIGRVHLRAVYFQRGQSQNWPSVSMPQVVSDQQNYFAFETQAR